MAENISINLNMDYIHKLTGQELMSFGNSTRLSVINFCPLKLNFGFTVGILSCLIFTDCNLVVEL
jgi:hypothetical protein